MSGHTHREIACRHRSLPADVTQHYRRYRRSILGTRGLHTDRSGDVAQLSPRASNDSLAALGGG